MPSFWSRNANADGAPRVRDRRSRSTDSRGAAKQLRCRLPQHDQDSSVTEASAAEQTKDSHWSGGNVDTTTSVADDVTDFQSLDEHVAGAEADNGCPDVKVLQYKVENEHLKELLRRRTHDLREKCSALSVCQTELAEALISQLMIAASKVDRHINWHEISKTASGTAMEYEEKAFLSNLLDRQKVEGLRAKQFGDILLMFGFVLRPNHSEMQMKLLREEYDQATLDLTALSGKMTTCTTIADEQAHLLKGQLDTIRKFEKKIQILEKTLKEMRTGHRQTVLEFESSMQEMQAENKEKLQGYENSMLDLQAKHKEKLQGYENSMLDLQAKHKEEFRLLEKSKHDMLAGYKEERAALEEQLRLHQQRAALQDRKIKRYHHERAVARSDVIKGRTRETEMEDQLHAQATVCKNTTKELSAATKEIEQLKNVSLELHEQEERMEQLWVDNARLVQLLGDSDEYQNLFQEMQEGKGLVFCPSETSRFESLAERYGAADSSVPINPKAERYQWIPAELYDVVMAFRKEYCFDLEIEIVKNLLRLVSTFWRERYKKVVYQVKLKHIKQVADLKRQFSQRQPYDQVVQSSYSRQTAKLAQTKASKNVPPATRREAFSHPEQSGRAGDIECSGSPPTRRGMTDEYCDYKAREVADTHNPREVQTNQSMSPVKRRETWSRTIKTSPVKYIDGHYYPGGGENPEDDHYDFYPESGSARKYHESNEKVGGVYEIHKDVGSRQRGHSPRKHRGRDIMGQNVQKPKSGRLRGFAYGLYPESDDEDDREKLSAPDRFTSSQRKNYYLRKSVTRSLDGSQDRDRSKPRRRIVAAKNDLDGFKSFSGSSSV